MSIAPPPEINKEPGRRSWASALSRIPEPFRQAMLAHARQLASASGHGGPDEGDQRHSAEGGGTRLTPLESAMLSGGKALSMITYAGFVPFHLFNPTEVDEACEILKNEGPTVLMSEMRELIEKSQTLMLIGDDPSLDAVDRAISEAKKLGDIKTLVAGPGNLMEPVLREWANGQNWPNAYLRTVDGSLGDVWHAQAGENTDELVLRLFDVHRPTLVALVQPVRLPATQASIEQASHRQITMITIEVNRLTKSIR